jgi:hypothetical protein
MPCALCHSDSELCESHIYPKFTYKRMREDEGRFLELSTSRKNPDGRTAQDGFKEKLLCLSCEALFQKSEEYFARVVNQKKLFDLPRPTDGKKWVRVHGFDYSRAKLFLLSILWRTHASKHPRFQMRLGDKHSNRLREMLLASDPGPSTEYGCVLAMPYVELADDKPVEMRPAVTVTPENVRWEHGLRIVRMQIDGLFLQFVVGDHDVVKRSDVRHLFLKEDGSMIVGVEDLTKIWFLRNSWGRTLGFF